MNGWIKSGKMETSGIATVYSKIDDAGVIRSTFRKHSNIKISKVIGRNANGQAKVNRSDENVMKKNGKNPICIIFRRHINNEQKKYMLRKNAAFLAFTRNQFNGN